MSLCAGLMEVVGIKGTHPLLSQLDDALPRHTWENDAI